MAVTVTAVVTALLLLLLLVVENTAGRKNNATTVAVHAAVVSLMDASRGGRPYQRMRGLFLHSLRRTAGYRGPCVFMVTGGSPHVLDEEMFERYGTRTVQVDLIKQSVLNARHHHGYGALLSKLHVWALTTYDIVVYYDSDVVFFRNPVAAALAACGGALAGQTLCATRDTALTRAGSGRPLFNAGFLVLRPDLAVHADLLRSLYLADGQFFPDQVTFLTRLIAFSVNAHRRFRFLQHLLNVYFRRRWTELNSSFNLMRPGEPRGGGGGLRAAMKATRGAGAGDGGVVAVHEKVRRLAHQPRCPSC
jgi:hypothetical protein